MLEQTFRTTAIPPTTWTLKSRQASPRGALKVKAVSRECNTFSRDSKASWRWYASSRIKMSIRTFDCSVVHSFVPILFRRLRGPPTRPKLHLRDHGRLLALFLPPFLHFSPRLFLFPRRHSCENRKRRQKITAPNFTTRVEIARSVPRPDDPLLVPSRRFSSAS